MYRGPADSVPAPVSPRLPTRNAQVLQSSSCSFFSPGLTRVFSGLITESLFSAAEYEGHDQTRGEPADVRHVGDSTPLRVLERRSVLAEYLRDYPQSQRHQSGN